MRKYLLIFLITLLWLTAPRTYAAEGEAGQPIPLLRWGASARGFAMGGAQIACPGDISSVYWNPASLAEIKGPGFTAFRANLYYDLGVDFVAFGRKIGQAQGFGAGWLGFNTIVDTDAGPMQVRQDVFLLSYSLRLNNLAVGLTGKYFLHSLGNDQTTGGSLDAGFKWGVTPRLNIAGVIQDVNQPTLLWTTGTAEKVPLNIKLGAAWQSGDYVLLAMDWEKCEALAGWHLGVEYAVAPGVFLRAGAKGDTLKSLFAADAFSAGIGIEAGENFMFDYAFVPSGLGDTHRFSLTYYFKSGNE